MNRIPTVAVIVPVYNQVRFIARCIRSLIAQDFPRDDYEIIVVDDASDDGTAQVLENFKDHIQILTNKKNKGLPAALNYGILMTTASLVVRVDSDDYVNAGFLRMLHMFLSQNNYMDAVACDYFLVNDTEEVIERKNCLTDPIGCGVMFRKDQLVNIGLYDEDFLRHEERDLRLRFVKEHKIYRLELPLYRYRRHSGNITNDAVEMEDNMARLLKKHGGTID